MELVFQNFLWYVSVPLVAIVMLGLNVMLRASGRRSVKLALKAWRFECKLELTSGDKHDRERSPS